MKTNRELNTAYEAKMAERVRPAPVAYNWKPLQDVIHSWIAKAK